MKQFALAILLFCLGGLPSALAQSDVQWHPDLEQAKQSAREQNKLVLLHFWATWCRPCMQLESYVFQHPSVADSLSEQVVAVKINVDQRPDLLKLYNVKKIPTDVVITPAGHVVSKRDSPASADGYLRMMAGLANTSSHANPSLLNSAETLQQNGLMMAQDASETVSIQNAFAPRDYRPPAFDSAGAFAKPDGAAMTADTYPPAIPSPNATANPANQAGSASPYATPAAVQNQYVESMRNANQFIPSTSADRQARAVRASHLDRESMATVRNPSLESLPPVGLDGYCPVTLHQQQKWVRGNTQWGCIHRGKAYLFESEAKRNLFLMAPDSYSPMLAGFDPVIYQQMGNLVEGKRSLGVFYSNNDGRQLVVLFQSLDSRQAFEADPSKYLAIIRQATAQADAGMTR